MKKEEATPLFDTLKALGFGDKPGLNEAVAEVIEKDLPEFKLSTAYYFTESAKMECLLYFRKSDKPDMYFFNRYEAVLRHPDDPAKDRMQTFYINGSRGVTFKEAFNLLEGRAVYKHLTTLEGEEYYAWIQLNFSEKDSRGNYKARQFYEQYGYDLEKTLAKYPIHELKNIQLKDGLLRSLKKGNLHAVTLLKKNKIERMLIEANPKYKTINLYRPGVAAVQIPLSESGDQPQEPD